MSLALDDAARLYGTLHHFLEVAVHLLLFHRGLYPARAFAAATAFDVPVHQCRHPAVCQWVREAVEAVVAALTGDTGEDDAHGGLPGGGRRVDSIALVVHAPFDKKTEKTTPARSTPSSLPPGAILERWVFDVRRLPRGVPGGADALGRAARAGRTTDNNSKGKQQQLDKEQKRQCSPQKKWSADDDDDDDDDDEGRDLDVDARRYDYYDEQDELAQAESEAELDDDDDDLEEGAVDNDREKDGSALNWADLHQQLRGVVLRLGQAAAGLGPLPANSSYTLAMGLDDDGEAAGTGRGQGRGGLAGSGLPAAAWIPHLHPGSSSTAAATTTIRSVDVPPMFLECWVEESIAAQRARQQFGDSSRGQDVHVLPPPPSLPQPSRPPRPSDTSGKSLSSTQDARVPRPGRGNKAVSFK